MKQKNRDLKTESADKLLVAAAEFIKAYGGSALVAGSIGVMNAEALRPLNYYLVIKITGKRPDLPAQSKP